MLNSILGNSVASINVFQFIICILSAFVIGLFFAYLYRRQSESSQSFVITLAILPVIVCVVIMMVNGNVGAGVAVAGAFSLVRFRSVPGSAREISMLFMAMASGLICGMGYLVFAFVFTILIGIAFSLLHHFNFGVKSESKTKTLRITIPEDLNYVDIFDDVLNKYTTSYEVISVKTTNMGSMFKLMYSITMKDSAKEKEFIDELRCRNGNLEISINREQPNLNEL